MNRFFFSLRVSLMAFSSLLFSSCGKPEKEVRVLHVATEANFPPYEYLQKGRIVGIDIDILSEIARNMGYQLKVSDMPFDSVVKSIQAGECDIAASGITITPERRILVNFTQPYVTSKQVVLVLKNSKINHPSDLRDKKMRIGVQQGTTSDSYVSKHLHNPLRYDNPGVAISAMIMGKLDAVVCDSEPAKIYAGKYSTLVILPEVMAAEEYAFALNKKDTELLMKINAELSKMKSNGHLQAILNKYLKGK